jgi:hypothetical protein
MGTTHGTEELGLCSHGLACQAGTWGRYIGFCVRYGHIWTKTKSGLAGKKCSARLVTLSHDEILTNRFLLWDAADADRGIVRVDLVTRERAT